VLSPFGLVPARRRASTLPPLLQHALAMMRSCGPDVPAARKSGVQSARHGPRRARRPRQGDDLSSRKDRDFGAWAEQLIANPPQGRQGLIPIDGEPLAMWRSTATIDSSSTFVPKAKRQRA